MFKNKAESFLKIIQYVLLIICVITCSDDIFLQTRIFGFNIRLSVLCMIGIILIQFSKMIVSRKFSLKIIAPYSLFIWVLILIIFIPNTNFLARNVLYVTWLIVYILFLICMNEFYEEISFLKIFKVYIYSFGIISIVGIIQFILFYFGIKFYLQQVFVVGIPRINGFSAEPSYYATFLLTGFVMNLYLINNKSTYFNFNYLVINQLLLLVAVLLSTSKMAIPLMIFVLLWSSFMDLYTRFVKKMTFYKKDLFVFPLILMGLLIGFYYFIFDFDKIKFLFGGLGIGGTVSHSVVTREIDFENTYKAFKKSPIIGYSLGGIPSAIGEIKGIKITTNELAKKHEGMNVFMETLAGSGVLGFLFFIIFLTKIFLKPFQISTLLMKEGDEERSILLKSLFWGGLALMLMLNFNQNILRPYLWVHLGMLSLAYFYAKKIIIEKQLIV